MPKYTKKEFALLCDIPTKSLSVYISRGNVLVGDDKKIDTALEINQYFVEQRKQFSAKKNNKPDATPVVSTETSLEDRTVKQEKKEVQTKFTFPAEHAPPTKNFQLDEKIKQSELEKSEINTQLLRAKLEKISGDSIPTELVKNLFIHHCKSITVSFQNGAENLLSRIAKTKGIERTEMAELRTELIEIINAAVNDSIEESKKGIKNLVAEHSQKKEVGERE